MSGSASYQDLIIAGLEKNGGKASRQLLGDYVLNHFANFSDFSLKRYKGHLKSLSRAGKITVRGSGSSYELPKKKASKEEKPKKEVKPQPAAPAAAPAPAPAAPASAKKPAPKAKKATPSKPKAAKKTAPKKAAKAKAAKVVKAKAKVTKKVVVKSARKA